jgi:hypothetical protein
VKPRWRETFLACLLGTLVGWAIAVILIEVFT